MAQPSAAGGASDPMLASVRSPVATTRTLRAASRASGPSSRQERAWVRAAQRGSAEALEALFRAHWSQAHRAAYLVVHDEAVAEDIAQEAFLAAVRALDRFDRSRPFGAWLNRIVVNRAIDFARSRALKAEVGAELCAVPEAAATPSGRPYSEAVMTALAALSPEQRGVVVLRYLLEYTPGEIATALDLPRGTVNSRLRRGLDALHEQLGEERP